MRPLSWAIITSLILMFFFPNGIAFAKEDNWKDEELFFLIDYLPLGTTFQQAKIIFPHLSYLMSEDDDHGLTHGLTQAFVDVQVCGRNGLLELNFTSEKKLYSYSLRIADLDCSTSEEIYDQLQACYWDRFGKYNEESETESVYSHRSSYWESEDFDLNMTKGKSVNRCFLSWGYQGKRWRLPGWMGNSVFWPERTGCSDDSSLTNLFRAKLAKSAPKAEILIFGESEKRRVTIEGSQNRSPGPESWAKVDRSSPRNIWSPDSLAYARLGFGDPPENLFVSSLVDSVTYFTCYYLNHTILLDAFWIDEHRFAILFVSTLYRDRPPTLQAFMIDLGIRQSTTWTIVHSGILPEKSSISDAVWNYDHEKMKR